jgi:CelD/BcsL family acetyltransferase involved in cellulose biosynthesis
VLSIKTATTPSEMERLRPAWEKLYANPVSTCTIFQSFAWNHLAATVFTNRESPHVVLIESDNGAVLIPAAVREHDISLIGESLFDYRDVLHAGDPSLIGRAWETLATLHRSFHLTALRDDAAEKWRALPVQPFCSAPQVLAGKITAEQFEAEHRRSARLLRRLEREGLELKVYPGTDSVLISTIYCKKATEFAGEESNLFRDPLRMRFMVHACALGFPLPGASDPATRLRVVGSPELRSAPPGTNASCEVFTLERSGALIAALVTFIDRRRSGSPASADLAPAGVVRRFYTVYFDTAWAKSSPGHALVYEVARQSLAEGLDCDFMTGEQPYKMRLATSSAPLFHLEASVETLLRASSEEPRLAA